MECESYASDRNIGTGIRKIEFTGRDPIFAAISIKFVKQRNTNIMQRNRCVESEQPNFHLPEYFENAVILKRK